MTFRTLVFGLVVSSFLTGVQRATSQSNDPSKGFDLVDETGNIRKPTDVRDLYQMLGTYTVFDPDIDGARLGVCGGAEMHTTYAP
jgi:hypothetical protein